MEFPTSYGKSIYRIKRRTTANSLSAHRNLDPYLALQIYSYALAAREHLTDLNCNAVQRFWIWALSDDERLKFAEDIGRLIDKKKPSRVKQKSENPLRSIEKSLNDLVEEFQDHEHYSITINRLMRDGDLKQEQIFDLMQKYFYERIKILSKKSTMKSSAFLKRLQRLKQTLKLSDFEAKIVTFLFAKSSIKAANALFETDEFDFSMPTASASPMASFFETSSARLGEAIGPHSRLLKSGVIRVKQTYSNDNLRLSPPVRDYLSGLSSEDIVAESLDVTDPVSDLSLEEFSLKKEVIDTLLDLFSSPRPSSVLFIGAPGTGKTELAKAIGQKLSKKIISLKQSDSDGTDDIDGRKLGLAICQHIMPSDSALVLVDECDALINTEPAWGHMGSRSKDEKAWINGYLDQNIMKVIWITNKGGEIEASTKRRFSMVVEFKELSLKDCERAWQIQARKNGLEDILTADRTKELAERYSLTPGSYALALKDIKEFPKDAQIARLYTILDQKNKFIHGKAPKLARKDRLYDLKALTTNIALTDVRGRVEQFLNRKSSDFPNFNILLMGPPGTGKTEFTKYLSDSLNRELVTKKASDLLSMWVGGTEKNIAEAFQEAEDKEAFLFLDEADSLFNNREQAQKPWQVTQTNELLTQMENFKGVLICATNFEQNLDPASLRRFAQKVTFDYLKPEAVVRLFDLYFGKKLNSPSSSETKDRLQRLQLLTPGDFKVVGQQFYWEESVSEEDLLRALEREATYKQRYSAAREIRLI